MSSSSEPNERIVFFAALADPVRDAEALLTDLLPQAARTEITAITVTTEMTNDVKESAKLRVDRVTDFMVIGVSSVRFESVNTLEERQRWANLRASLRETASGGSLVRRKNTVHEVTRKTLIQVVSCC